MVNITAMYIMKMNNIRLYLRYFSQKYFCVNDRKTSGIAGAVAQPLVEPIKKFRAYNDIILALRLIERGSGICGKGIEAVFSRTGQ